LSGESRGVGSAVGKRTDGPFERAPRPPSGGRGRRQESTIRAVIRHPPLRLYLVAWVPLVAVYVALFLAGGSTPATAIRSAVLTVVPFALLGLLVVRVPLRVPWSDERRGTFFATQLGLMAAYALGGAAGVVAAWTLDSFLFRGRFEFPAPLMIAAWQAVFGGLIYAAIVGAAYAWQNAQSVREESARAARADALRARAELATLRSQLNPHFLLNTLHAALGLVRRDPARAEQALERLGELLHYGLRMHREALDQVTLAQEWAFVRSYLEVESLRLEDRLQLRLDAEPEAMDCLVPPFVLQPLVENAILHAVAPRKNGGRVTVTTRRQGELLQIEVSDDGPGLPSAPERSGSGLGLQLLRERLAMLYAGRAQLSLRPADGGGLRATIDLPLDARAMTEPR
jgi:signal transduction histidine kinase